MGTCTDGCKSKKAEEEVEHKHKYCHVNEEDKHRTRTAVAWETKPIMREQEVLKPFKKMVKKMVLQKKKLTMKVV